MLLTDTDVRATSDGTVEVRRSSTTAVVVGAAGKTILAALAGLLLACGLGLFVWAVTPSSGGGPLALVRAGIGAFCAANGMTLDIGRSGLTLHPLMLTLVIVALLASVTGRGWVVACDREQEGVAVLTSALLYALAVTGIGSGVGGSMVSAAQWWRPAMLAFVVVGSTTLIRGDSWRLFVRDRLPVWVPVSLRCGGAAMAALLGGGAITLVIGLIRSFGDSITVQTLAAPGAAGGFGMALLGIGYLPNAVVAATGYSTGVGFTIGSGNYTPFGSSPVELPAVSLFTAVPDGHGFARPTLLLLLFPVLAAVLIGHGAVRRLENRTDRLFAAGGAAVFTGVLSTVIAGVAGGGVTGGEWSNTGVPPVLFGFVVTGVLGVVGVAIVALTKVPFVASADVADATSPAAQGDTDQAESPDLPSTDPQMTDDDGTEASDAPSESSVLIPSVLDPSVLDHAESDQCGTPVGSADQSGPPAQDADVNPVIPDPREEGAAVDGVPADGDTETRLPAGPSGQAEPHRTG